MVEQPQVKSRIPEFSTLEEEAEFWDTHDTTEFEDEFEPVEMEVARPLRHAFLVSFEGPVFGRILAYADRHGLGFQEMASQWVMAALDAAETAERDADAAGT